MKRNALPVIIGFFLCLAAIVAVFLTMREARDGTSDPLPAQQDLTRHPVYSSYRFSPGEGVIRIGMQPLWVYGANIAEAMRHDRLLSRELAAIGLRTEFHSFLKGPDINFFMERDHLDAGMSGYLPTLRIAAVRDILIPATVDQNFFDFVVGDGYTVTDLKGKAIGFPRGSDAHHALIEALDLTGIQAKLVPMDLDVMPEAMRTGRIDACVAWEPATSLVLAENRTARIVYRSLWTSFLYFRGGFAKAHPQAVNAILASQARAIRWFNADPANQILSSRWAIDACNALAPESARISLADFVKQSRDAAALSKTPLVFDADLADGRFLHNAFLFLKKERMIPADADWQKTRAMFDTKLMKTVLGEPHRWRLDEFDYENKEDRP